jgi:hypothetical protein
MLTVHKMPHKNQFLTGISSRHNKTPNQNELQPFTSLSFTNDCMFDFLGKESYQRLTTTFAGTGIVYNAMIKPDAEMILFDGGFKSFRFNFEIEMAKSNTFLRLSDS